MKACLAKRVVGIALCLCGALGWASPSHSELDGEADRIVAAYSGFSRADIERMRHETAEDAVAAFRRGMGFLDTVAKSDLSDDEKAVLVAKVADAAGGFFDAVTEPFENLMPEPPSWTDLGHRIDYQNKFLRALKWTGDRIVAIGAGILRDALCIIPLESTGQGNVRFAWPSVFAFFGKDTNRSSAAKGMAGVFADRLTLELSNTEAAAANPAMLSGLKRLLGRMESAEPLRYGERNGWMRRVYLGLAIFTFLNPPLEPFLERTTYSPLVAATFWTAVVLYFRHARKQDTGFASYKVVKKALKAIDADPAKKALWASCGQALEAIGTDPSIGRRRRRLAAN